MAGETQSAGAGASPPACGDATLEPAGERLLLLTCVSQASGQEAERIWALDADGWELVAGDGPPPLVVTGAAYDRARDVVVRYGGLPLESNTCVPETWEWDGSAWAQATTADDPHPTACDHMKLAYDVDVGHTLLVGGGDDDLDLSSETWAWDGSDWTLLDEDGPVGRAHHGLVHDDANDRTLLYGGYDGESVFDDFWSWDGTAWTEIDESGPGPRSHHGLAIDSDGQLLLFGGATGPSSFTTVQSDTWMLTDGAWTQVDARGPSARLSPALGYDPEQGLWVLYGGFGADGSELGDTWAFDGTTWQCLDGC